MSDENKNDLLAALLPKLRQEEITYFPVRHHSPVCAMRIEDWIIKNKPRAILVEGPASFNSRIDLLTDVRCLTPVALFTTFVDKKRRLQKLTGIMPEPASTSDENEKEESEELLASRFSAYYPFCDYSPELVALRVGKTVGAKLKFIDMEYGEMVLAERRAQAQLLEKLQQDGARALEGDGAQGDPPKVDEGDGQDKEPSADSNGDKNIEILSSEDLQRSLNLLDSLTKESHLRHSSYIESLSKAMGCRDFDELWDHLFEAQCGEISTEALIDRLATYCALARSDYSEQDLFADGTTAREARMAAHIIEELKNGKKEDGPVLVVTGGFHTVALPALVSSGNKAPSQENFEAGEIGVWLIRYAFDKLDSHSGYGAGMPSPAFYEQIWQAARGEKSSEEVQAAVESVGADFIVEVSRRSRASKLPYLVTTPDAVAALQMAKQLAMLRGHAHPARVDILDGMRTCFIKGEVNVEGQALASLVRQVFAGDKLGAVPPDCDLPPIVADFYNEAKKLRIDADQTETKVIALDLYRKKRHRSISRFFHRLSLLRVPFVSYVDGPDFVYGRDLTRFTEHWRTLWSPAVESALIEAAALGTSIEEASAQALAKQIAALEGNGGARSSSEAVTVLLNSCKLGLHKHARALMPIVALSISEDPLVTSVVKAITQLDLLRQAREPLAASHLDGIPALEIAAYRKATALLHTVANCSAIYAEQVLGAIKSLREFTANTPDTLVAECDTTLFYAALRSIVKHPAQESRPVLVGAAIGILHCDGRISSAELMQVVSGYFSGTLDDAAACAGVVRGLLETGGLSVWQDGELTKSLDKKLSDWDDDTFMNLLPELRLAFSVLTPREIARLSEIISVLHGGAAFGSVILNDIAQSDLHLGVRLNAAVRTLLKKDNLVEAE
ncbi:MAG: hypothetical protein K2Y32_05155 [Candidatus Obscuribacterales bacterium]|nr:hypothetical protein [Candidatus Obscuribacterales bacterium]